MERDRKGQHKLDIAAAPAVAAHRYRRLAPGEKHAGSGRGLAEAADLRRDSGYDARNLAGFPLDGVAKNERSDPGLPRDLGCPRSDISGVAIMVA